MNLTKFHYSILKDPSEMKFEMYSFMKILCTAFELTPAQAARLEWLVNDTWYLHRQLFNNSRYENVLLGLMRYILEESIIDTGLEPDRRDLSEFIEQMYSEKEANINKVQVYSIYQTLLDIIPDSSSAYVAI